MPSSIVSPFPVFNDLDGTPLEAGYIYIGQSNLNPESAPINVFWDAACTIPAAQPIRTVGGYASRNGSPSRMYVPADTYSITVRNRNRVFVFAAFDQTDAPTSVFDISTQVITATAGQLTFALTTFTYLPGTDTLQVYRNGLRLTMGADYIETNSSTVTLTTAAAAGDEFLFQGGAVITGNQTPGTAVSFIQAGTGAVTRNMQDKVRESVSVKDYGAVGNGVTDDTAAIQAAINAVNAIGGGIVELNSGTYVISSSLTIYSKVILAGKGPSCTEIFLKNGSNCTMIKSYNYDTLIGSNTWLVANGCTFAYGLKDLRLNGNKSGQTSGNGVQFYGKRLNIENVMIVQCKQEGWHSESNYSIPGEPAQNGDDMPEGLIRGLYIWECDSHGFVFKGQHDTYIASLFVGVCGGWGVRFETNSSAPYYSGNCDSGFMHVYANTLGGVYIGTTATHQSAFMISESNFGVGLQCDGWQTKIGTLQLYTNCRTSGNYQAIVSASECILSAVHLKSSATGGISITGDRNFANITAVESSNTKTGVDVSGQYNRVNATIRGYSGAGGIGLRTGNSSQLVNSYIKATLQDCTTLWNNSQVGSLNSYSITGYAGAGQIAFSGNGPNVNNVNEDWDVKFNSNGTVLYSKRHIRQFNAVNLNSTSVQTITIPHSLVSAPQLEDCSVTLGVSTTGNWVIAQPFFIKSVDATNVIVEGKLATAHGSSFNGDILLSISL